MKSAIISGSTGLIGSSFIKFLISKKIKVLCIGRKKISKKNLKKKFGLEVKYISLEMKKINNLKEKIKKIGFDVSKNCVFFSFAWSGKLKLTDGNFEEQFINSIYSASAIKIAKELGCSKFINCGSVQEDITENAINKTSKLNNSQINYSLSKIASRDICKILGYILKIDYIHTSLSVPIDPKSEKKSYIMNVLKNILNKKKYISPTNSQQYDIVHIADVCRAYYLLGHKGKNNVKYYIGTSNSLTLEEYFSLAEVYYHEKKNKIKANFNSLKIFNIENLVKDTGFKPKYSYFDILKNL